MSIDTSVFNLLAHPPWGFMRRELIGTLSGDGQLTRPGGLFPFDQVNAFGLAWSFFSIPTNLGFKHGVSDEYEERIIDLAAVFTLGDTHDFNAYICSLGEKSSGVYRDGGVWLWPEAGPTKILYSIFPFCEVTLFWLIQIG